MGPSSVKPDAYRILEVRPEADADEIKRAYLRLMRQHHPDLGASGDEAQERARMLNAAFDCLKEPQRRAAYDRSLGRTRVDHSPARPAPLRLRPAARPAQIRATRLKRLRNVRRFQLVVLAVALLLVAASVLGAVTLALGPAWTWRQAERTASDLAGLRPAVWRR